MPFRSPDHPLILIHFVLLRLQTKGIAVMWPLVQITPMVSSPLFPLSMRKLAFLQMLRIALAEALT